ncbi:MAG: nucleoside-diphosphate sugar epimerase/dehydratase [Marivibrio sp.]|uniref:polysaccharide biosynthesis protein n=1 Tax=Marivibrio sp. TaxID=2039719 RepID=UPI0032EC0A69
MTQLLRVRRARVAFLHDVAMAAASFPLALYLRLGDATPYFTRDYLWEGTALFALCAALAFSTVPMYRGIWRYASLNDLVAITKAVTLAVLLFVPLLFLLTRLEMVPRSAPIIQWFLLIAMLGGPRFLYRIMKDRHLGNVLSRQGVRRVPVLLIGAADEAELFIREQQRDPGAPYKPVGIIDEKGGRVGREMHGVPVMGSIDDLDAILERWRGKDGRPERLVLTRERLDGAAVRRVLEIGETHGLTLARLPKLSELKAGGFSGGALSVRPIAVEDLLGRPQIPLDRAAMKGLIEGRRVLVTGAGGTIGSELVRQILDFRPSEIALLDASEYQLYLIDLEAAERAPDLPRHVVLGDVRDRGRIEDVMTRLAPELVFHAAALKHVPMVEANPLEGILTNTLGSRIVADACRKAGVACMVQISTDKVVNPTNVMGATKRLAEAYIQALDPVSRGEGATRFVVVRFGNVLGSTGSVVPLFQRQLAAGGPLTVTHPDVTRYFMTVREAVELVLQASVVGVEDQDAAGRIFVLDMGEPVKVLDLARQMIHLAGLQPDRDVRIEFTGLRPGEKLFEELLHDEESQLPTRAPGMTLAAPRAGDALELGAALDALEAAARGRARADALARLAALVPEFTPDPETLKAARADAAPNSDAAE